MVCVAMSVNGRAVSATVPVTTLLVHFLRETLGLTGTHVGCDTSQCGSCVVHMNGFSVKSCSILAVQASGEDIVTIEGVADGRALHPMQEAFRAHHGLQCGYCTPGMVMAALDIVRRYPDSLTPAQIRHELEGNICRCTGYNNIVKAIMAAWRVMRQIPVVERPAKTADLGRY